MMCPPGSWFGLGGAALWQLGLQRKQLHDQQEVIRSQALILERQQANKIDVRANSVDGGRPPAKVLPEENGELVHIVMVANGSDRPIREVVVNVVAIQTDRSIRHERLAHVYGEMVMYALGVESGCDEHRDVCLPCQR